MRTLVQGPIPYYDDDEERWAVSACGFTMNIEEDGVPVEHWVAENFLELTLIGLPQHDPPYRPSASVFGPYVPIPVLASVLGPRIALDRD